MITEFKLPALGENIVSGTISKIPVKVGDAVKKDQTVLELETDKATIEVPSSTAGVVKEILIKVGDQAKVGQLMMKIEAGTATAQTPASGQPARTTKDEGRGKKGEGRGKREEGGVKNEAWKVKSSRARSSLFSER